MFGWEKKRKCNGMTETAGKFDKADSGTSPGAQSHPGPPSPRPGGTPRGSASSPSSPQSNAWTDNVGHTDAWEPFGRETKKTKNNNMPFFLQVKSFVPGFVLIGI